MHGYDPQAIEKKWQALWEARGSYRVPGPGDAGFDASRPKAYVLDMFPYPSGKGLHIGHPLGYIATDIYARYLRMTGRNVLHPMGFDAFGLPAEQYAIEHNVHPRLTTETNISTMVEQLKMLGLGYDWEREIRTMDPGYYRWTQWIFLQCYKSWYDPRVPAARPIADLEAELTQGVWRVGTEGKLLATAEALEGDGSRAWTELSAAERDAALDRQRLAYLAEVPVNWCPGLGTVLANEEVTAEGRSERGNFPVYRRPLKQWMLRITAYADRLLADLEGLDWPEATRHMQRNWIGRSVGARVRFPIAAAGGATADRSSGPDSGVVTDGPGAAAVEVFTTRPDTIFGATYMVLAPEHPLVDQLTLPAQRAAVAAYRVQTAARSEVDRQTEGKVKTGVDTGGRAVNPATGERIPVWIADYVLMGYGTGAIMAVPAHDQRDFAFARAFDLPVVPVLLPDEGWLAAQAAAAGRPGTHDDYLAHVADYGEVFTGEGLAVNSATDAVSLDGQPSAEARKTVIAWLERTGQGAGKVQYRLRDWLFSRQRYWGEPFPILHGPDGRVRPVDEADLPVLLPDMEDFKPEGSDDPDAPPRPPLARAPESWRKVVIDGITYERELNTMPNWAGSNWYYLRYLDPRNDHALVDPAKERYWMGDKGIDLYVGGAEHAVLHLLYVRFWHKVLYDLGHVGTVEPVQRLVHQGMIQAYAYTDDRGVHVPADEVVEQDGSFHYQGQAVNREYGKMGKSLKNMVTPEDVVASHGVDILRLYEMYLGPLEASKPWSTRDMVGIRRFLGRVWRAMVDRETGALRVTDAPADDEHLRLLHRTIAKVSADMPALQFNTAIAALIELTNALTGLPELPRTVAEPLVLMLAPMAPHLGEELWERLGHADSVTTAPWPAADPRYLAADTVEIAVQVLGKVRARIQVPAGTDRAELERLALAEAAVQPFLAGKTVRKVIVVPGSLVNIVAN